MAGVDVLGADKTGLITKNELTAGEIRAFDGHTKKDVMLFAVLASREEDKDPIDDVITARAKSLEGIATQLAATGSSLSSHSILFQSELKTTVQDISGAKFQVSKGAPQVILSLDNFSLVNHKTDFYQVL